MNPVLQRINSRNLNFKAFAEYSDSDKFAIELRKKKRMEKAQMKRLKIQDSRDVEFDSETFDKFNIVLAGSDLQEIQKVLMMLKNICMQKEKVDYQVLVMSDLVSKIMILLQEDWPLDVIENASLVIVNLSFGPTVICDYMLHRGITEILAQLIGKNFRITENAVWTLSNLAVEGEEVTEMIVNSGCPQAILKYLEQFNEFQIEFARVVLWAGFNLIKGLPKLSDQMIHFFSQVLFFFKDATQYEDLKTHWLKLVLQFAKFSSITGDIIIEKHFSKILLDLLSSSQDRGVLNLTLLTIGNIIFNSAKNTQILISFHLMDRIFELLKADFFENHCQAYWVLGNIAGGTPSQTHQLVFHSVFFESFSGLHHPNPLAAYEVSMMIYNLTLRCTEEDLMVIVEKGAIDAFHSVLDRCSEETLFNILRSSVNILCGMNDNNRRDLFDRIDRMGYWSQLQNFELSQHPGISKMAESLSKRLEFFLY
jgi:hypothetical protein